MANVSAPLTTPTDASNDIRFVLPGQYMYPPLVQNQTDSLWTRIWEKKDPSPTELCMLRSTRKVSISIYIFSLCICSDSLQIYNHVADLFRKMAGLISTLLLIFVLV